VIARDHFSRHVQERDVTGRERRIVIGVLAGFAVFAAWLRFYNPAHMAFFCQEDGFVEYSQAFLYLGAAGIFAFIATRKGFRNVWYLGYALLFFALFGEEVSWGQRIFNLLTPAELDAINVQHETNLHNIEGLHRHVRMIGFFICLTICYAIPLTDRYLAGLQRLYRVLKMPIFPMWTAALPTIGFAFMIVPRLFGIIDFDFDEMGELYLALGFFGFALSAYLRAGAVFGRERAPMSAAAPTSIGVAPSL
jgi:hypothetical protein